MLLISNNEYKTYMNEFEKNKNIFVSDNLIKYNFKQKLDLILDVFDIKVVSMHKENNKNKVLVRKYKDLKALILEDNDVNIKVLSETLFNMNIKFDIAKTKEEGINLVRENTYDILLSDFIINDFDGIEFINEIKEFIHEKMVKVVLTASLEKSVKEKCLASGFDEFVSKPYSIKEIDEIFYKYFEQYYYRTQEIQKNIDNREYYVIFINHLRESILKFRWYAKNKEKILIKKLVHNLRGGTEIVNETKILSLLNSIDDNLNKEDFVKISELINLLERELIRLEEKYI